MNKCFKICTVLCDNPVSLHIPCKNKIFFLHCSTYTFFFLFKPILALYIVHPSSLCLKVHVFAWLFTVNTMAKTSEACGLGMFIWAESLEMEQRYECWSVKGTAAVSLLLAITHKHHLAASRQTERTSHLHTSHKSLKSHWYYMYLSCTWRATREQAGIPWA